jgi:hypothetical protein
MKDISRFISIILKFAKCGPPCEGRGKWIMDYGILRLGLTLNKKGGQGRNGERKR